MRNSEGSNDSVSSLLLTWNQIGDSNAEAHQRASMQCELPDDDADLAVLAEYGLTDPALLDASVAWNIGPLFGISAAGRLLRMLTVDDAFVDPHADSVRRRAVAARILSAFAQKRKLVFGDPSVD